jgi:hypothetical protein
MPNSSRCESLSSKAKKQLEALSSSRKAQFLIITAFVIVSIFYLVSKWMQPYRIPDTSAAVLMEEPFIFNNIKEKALKIVATSKSCEELVDNLDEYQQYVNEYAFKKLVIYFDYSIETPCYEAEAGFPILVLFDIRLRGSSATASSSFYGFWPPGSAP